jgi:glycosyltransferase involved in cell wall biosynthesis
MSLVAHSGEAELEIDQRDGNAGPSVSLVIEWDNARLSELGRARQMLAAVQAQVVAHEPKPDAPVQLIILYDKHDVDPALIETTLRESTDPAAWDVDIRLVATDGLKYYELKNTGVTHSDRDVVIFLDSDVVPDDGWFDALMGAIDDPAVEVVGGNTYVATDSFLAKAFSLFWVFDQKAEDTRMFAAEKFFANNVAFKRVTFERYFFPQFDAFHGQCYVLAKQMTRDGITIYRHNGARASHPPTNGIAHFIKRGICEGHDYVVVDRIQNPRTWRNGLLGAMARLPQRLRRLKWSTEARYRQVGLSAAGAFGAFGVGSAYIVLEFLGETLACVNPGLVRKRFFY